MAKDLTQQLKTVTTYANLIWDILVINLHLLYTLVTRIVKLFSPPAPRDVNGEIVLVTGGSNGIGREILVELAKRNSSITLISWDVDSERNQSTVKELKALGVSKAYSFDVDVTDDEQVAAAATRVRNEIGDVTMLFNNAGISGKIGTVWELEKKSVEKVLNVNLLSHFSTLREFLPAMIAKNKGNVIATCSILGFLWGKNGSPYVASKHAVKASMECLKEELRGANANNVKVSLVYPSLTYTNIVAGIQLQPQKYPFLVQGMKPSYVAKQIIDGVLNNEEHIYVPDHGRIPHMFMSLVPAEVLAKIYNVLDVDPLPAKPA